MSDRALRALCLMTLATAMIAADAHAERIGVASTVRNEVRGEIATEVRDLETGDEVLRNELVATGDDSATQLLFLDQTSVTIGSNARLTLNKFVYDPDTSAGDVVIGAAKGGFRFISGVVENGGYRVETPRATIGIRGSIIEGYVDAFSGDEVHILVEGAIEVCPTLASATSGCVSLDQPGAFVRVTPRGDIVGPATWRGPLLSMNLSIDYDGVAFGEAVRGGRDPLSRTDMGNDALDLLRLSPGAPAIGGGGSEGGKPPGGDLPRVDGRDGSGHKR